MRPKIRSCGFFHVREKGIASKKEGLRGVDLVVRFECARLSIKNTHDKSFRFQPLSVYMLKVFIKIAAISKENGRLCKRVASVCVYIIRREGSREFIVGCTFNLFRCDIVFSEFIDAMSISKRGVLICYSFFVRRRCSLRVYIGLCMRYKSHVKNTRKTCKKTYLKTIQISENKHVKFCNQPANSAILTFLMNKYICARQNENFFSGDLPDKDKFTFVINPAGQGANKKGLLYKN